jgi:hypothetical protein
MALPALLSLGVGCGAERTQPGEHFLRDLAREWAGSTVPPECVSDVQQQRDGVPPHLRTENCAWPVQSRGRGVMRLTGVKTPTGQLGLLIREEDVIDSAAAFRLRDSLSRDLRVMGFREYQCYVEDRQWRSSSGAVHFWIGAVFPSGLLKTGITAVADAKHIPAIACPDSSARLVR